MKRLYIRTAVSPDRKRIFLVLNRKLSSESFGRIDTSKPLPAILEGSKLFQVILQIYNIKGVQNFVLGDDYIDCQLESSSGREEIISAIKSLLREFLNQK